MEELGEGNGNYLSQYLQGSGGEFTHRLEHSRLTASVSGMTVIADATSVMAERTLHYRG